MILKEQYSLMAIFLVFVTNLLNLCGSTLLMHKLLYRLLREQNHMSLEKKIANITFLKNLPEVSSWSPFPSWPFATRQIC